MFHIDTRPTMVIMCGMTPIDAIAFYGSQHKLARALKISQPAIAKWVRIGHIPPVRQYQIQVVSRGKLLADKVAA